MAPNMSREEVSALGSARREEVRRMLDESEKLRANPLLYLVSPQVKVGRRCLLGLELTKSHHTNIILVTPTCTTPA